MGLHTAALKVGKVGGPAAPGNAPVGIATATTAPSRLKEQDPCHPHPRG